MLCKADSVLAIRQIVYLLFLIHLKVLHNQLMNTSKSMIAETILEQGGQRPSQEAGGKELNRRDWLRVSLLSLLSGTSISCNKGGPTQKKPGGETKTPEKKQLSESPDVAHQKPSIQIIFPEGTPPDAERAIGKWIGDSSGLVYECNKDAKRLMPGTTDLIIYVDESIDEAWRHLYMDLVNKEPGFSMEPEEYYMTAEVSPISKKTGLTLAPVHCILLNHRLFAEDAATIFHIMNKAHCEVLVRRMDEKPEDLEKYKAQSLQNIMEEMRRTGKEKVASDLEKLLRTEQQLQERKKQRKP